MPEKDQIAAQLPQFRMKNMKFQSELAAESHVCEKRSAVWRKPTQIHA